MEKLEKFRTFLAPLALAPLTFSLIMLSGTRGWADPAWANACAGKTGPAAISCMKEVTKAATGGTGAPISTATDPSDIASTLGSAGQCATNVAATQVADANSATKIELHNFDVKAQSLIDKATPAEKPKLTTCQADVASRAQALNSQINSLNQLETGKLCAAMKKYNSKNLIDIVKSSKGAADYSEGFNEGANALDASYCNAFNAKTADCTKLSSGNKSADSKQPVTCETMCGSTLLATTCETLSEDYHREIVAMQSVTGQEAINAHHTWNMVKVGMGVAAVGATVGIVKAIQHHNDANRRAKVRNDYANGILHNADGTTTDCKSSANYMSDACQPVLMEYCSKPENSGATGCGAFTQSYCALSTASASYCISNTAQTYCQSYSAQSPACQWMATRPTSCAAKPDQQDCLSSLTNAQLTSECPNFPNDPLCQAFSQGKVVNQSAPLPVATATPTTGSNTDGGFDTVIGSGTTIGASTAATSPTTTSSTTTTGSSTLASTTTTSASTSTFGSTIGGAPTARVQMRGQPVANMWSSDSQTLASLCTSGALACSH